VSLPSLQCPKNRTVLGITSQKRLNNFSPITNPLESLPSATNNPPSFPPPILEDVSRPPFPLQSNVPLPRTRRHPPRRILCLRRPRMVPHLPPPRSHRLRPPPHHRNHLCNPSVRRAPHAPRAHFSRCVSRRGKQDGCNEFFSCETTVFCAGM
jgi:hypothetical protein